jgi:hypothetical protein
LNFRLVALDFICACLGEDVDPEQNTALRSTARSGHLHWPTVIQIANDHLVSPALWVALRARGLTNDLPTDVGEYLSELHRLNSTRNEGLRSQVIEAGRALNAIGVVPLLLKGAATLLSNIQDDPGYRVMRDLDLLVPESQAKVCWHALRSLGYQPTSVHNGLKIAQAVPRDFERHHHLHPLHRPGDYATVEIHKASLPQPHGQLLPNEPLLGNATCIEADGIALLVPAPSDSVLHALVHALLVDRAHARGLIPIRVLHDVVKMQRHFGDRVDWDIIRRCFRQVLQEGVWDDTLYLGRRLFHFTTGAGIHESLATRLHFTRTRTQVRWPWADALAARALCFSTEDICARYQCDRQQLIVNWLRLRFLASILARKIIPRSP